MISTLGIKRLKEKTTSFFSSASFLGKIVEEEIDQDQYATKNSPTKTTIRIIVIPLTMSVFI